MHTCFVLFFFKHLVFLMQLEKTFSGRLQQPDMRYDFRACDLIP